LSSFPTRRREALVNDSQCAPPFPFDRTRDPLDPPPEFARWQREQPIRRVVVGDVPAWLVTRYSDVRALLADPRLSCDRSRAGFPAARKNDPPPPRGHLSAMDPPEHTELRRIIMRSALVNDVTALRPVIEQHANALLDKVTRLPQPVDLVKQFALALPVRVICELFGVPYHDRRVFVHCANVITNLATNREQAATAYASLAEYLGNLIDAKEREPADDLLSELVKQHVHTGQITREQAVGLSLILLTAGHATTANQIALSVAVLLRHPDQAELLLHRPELLPDAVEELLRYLTIAHHGLRRVATADISVGGTVIRAGEGVVLALQAANRDPDVFADPDRVDLTRRARRHVAFGHGAHRCAGQALARAELEIALSTLFRRLPELRLAIPFERIAFDDHGLLHGVPELPVLWRQNGETTA
jgi:cytochrome P450